MGDCNLKFRKLFKKSEKGLTEEDLASMLYKKKRHWKSADEFNRLQEALLKYGKDYDKIAQVLGLTPLQVSSGAARIKLMM